jgi:hypothetical protein
MPDSMSGRPKRPARAAPTAKGKRRSKNNNELPADLAARLDIIRKQYSLAKQHQRREAAFYLAIGEQWYAIKDDDELLDRIGGIAALEPFLPNTPPFLNRCAVMWGAMSPTIWRREKNGSSTPGTHCTIYTSLIVQRKS